MAQHLRANTEVKVRIGPAVAVGDGFTPVTTLALGTADEAELLKHNGAAIVDISGATFAAIASCDGYYDLTLTTAYTDTEGLLDIVINDDSLNLPILRSFTVLSEAAYDSLYGAKDTGYMDVNIKAISEDTTAADNAELAFDGTGYGFANCTMPTVTTLTGHTVQTGDSFARIGAAGASLTGISWNSAWDAEVQSECADALTAIHLDHLLATDYDPASKPGTATALLNELVENDTGVSRFTENALEQAPSGTGASAATIADAVWDEAQADHVGAGTFGVVASEVADILADTNELQTDDTPGAIAALNNVSSADVTTACTSSLNTYDPPTRAELTTDTNSVITQVNANETKIDTMQGNVTDILADTNELQTDDIPTTLAAIVAYLDTEIAAILEDTGTTLPATLAALNNISTADVNAQVVDVLKTDTVAEMAQGIPPTTPTFEQAIMYLYMALTKSIDIDTTLKEFYNNAGTVIWKKTLSDDGTNYVEAKGASGP